MKKRLVFGDIHTHFDTLFGLYEKHNPDSVIILGDYFDSFSRPPYKLQVEGFNKLLELKKTHEESGKGDFTLILGNHDYHYSNYCTDTYSGFNLFLKNEARNIVTNAIVDGTIKVVLVDKVNKTIYSHAGVTEYWFNQILKGESLEDINKIENIKSLDFNYETGINYYGDTISQSPIWVRPDSLCKNHLKGWNQVVGHTHTKEPIIENFDDGSKLYIIDTMPTHYIIETLDDDNKLIERNLVTDDNEGNK